MIRDGQPAAETSGREEPPHPWPSAPLVPTLLLCPQVPVGFFEMDGGGEGEWRAVMLHLVRFLTVRGSRVPCVSPSEELPAQSWGWGGGVRRQRERDNIRASGRGRAK